LPCPSITTIHDIIPRRFPGYFPRTTRLLIAITTRLAIYRSAHILAVSETTARDLERYYRVPRRKLTVTPWGVEPRFRPQPAEALAGLHTRYDLPDRYTLYLGSNKPHKNLPLLIAAWARVVAQPAYADETLVIAGPWDDAYPEARQLAEAHGLAGCIRWLGVVEEQALPALYAGATLCVFPSRYEGFG